ncbi:MAG: 4Fe-4S binding protein [Syntrophomonadaceae bacterium]|nr:4Fe-4S binding protein [Syntrophomonadaceae bacterium]
MYQKIRLGIQLFASLLALLLLGVGVYSFNLLYVASALGLAFFAGRFFCGWLCPLGLFTERVLKFFSREKKIPAFMTKSWFRYGFTALFLAGFVILWVSPLAEIVKPFILMGTMFVLAIIIGVLFYPKGWCAYVCPWGVLSSMIGRVAPYQMVVGEDCKGCLRCAKACPVTGILEPAIARTRETKEAAVMQTRCIRCLQCAGACPLGNIDLKSASQIQTKAIAGSKA